MGIFRKYTPVAADLPLCEVMAACFSRKPIGECLSEIGPYLGVRHLFPVSSGRAALYAILKAALPPGSKVILPGYTCYTVAAAVVRAGMTPILSDSRRDDLGFDLDRLRETLKAHSDVRAIVVCHLFGIALNINEIMESAGPDILIIDDAAQAYGIKANGKFLGTAGDAGFYSFGRGKNLSLVGGGLLVTNDDSLADRIAAIINNEFAASKDSAGEFLKAASYNWVTAPYVFNIISRLPGMRLGRSEYDPHFPTAGMSSFKIRLLHRLYKFAERMNIDRLAVARHYLSIFESSPGVTIPKSRIDNEPGSLRFVMLVGDSDKRDKILAEGRKRGWGFSAMYPTALNGVADLKHPGEFKLEGSEYIARSILTLPTHRYIKVTDRGHPLMRQATGLFQ